MTITDDDTTWVEMTDLEWSVVCVLLRRTDVPVDCELADKIAGQVRAMQAARPTADVRDACGDHCTAEECFRAHGWAV